ncbi:TetR-like C-terminal domain-containing protein [Microbacterium terregens]|uniref:TetR-like C-terminal domain-containing protein n=1 Tax=Microbacterium terregens TaxID=69363 RepID=UPI0031DAB433
MGERACGWSSSAPAWTPTFARLKESLYQAGSGGFRAIVERAKESGELPGDLDTELAIDQLAGPLMFRRLLASAPSARRNVHAVVDAFLAANARRPGPRAADGGGES